MGGDLSWPLMRAADLYAADEAVHDPDRSATYEELARDVRALASGLDELGLQSGARMGFLGVNSLAHAECVMGVPAARRVLVDLNFRLAEAELAFIASDCAIEVLVTDHHRLDVARALKARCPSLDQLVFDGNGPCPEECIPYRELLSGSADELPAVPGDEVAAISYTGGTTGAPKGVMLSHENLLANARHNLIATGHHEDDRWLHVCPMFHVAGTANMLACTWVGAEQIVLPRFDARAVIDTIRERAITHTVLVPAMLGMLLDELERESDGDRLRSLRHIQYAASPIAPALQRRVLEYFDCDIAQFYGMTEAAPTVSHLSPEEHRRGARGEEPHAARLRSIGVPVVGVETDIRAPDGSRTPMGDVGELCVRGPNVMLGYWNQPDATAEVLRDGWYRSGDAARRDEDGYLYLVDRLKDMIITGGENVYSIEVEAALSEHEAVSEAAVFGIPDPRWGEAVHAVVTIAPGSTVTKEELTAHCRMLLAGYKLPRTIELRSAPLPRSGAGKLLKNALREPFWAGLDRRVN